jgi:hypothetical protein
MKIETWFIFDYFWLLIKGLSGILSSLGEYSMEDWWFKFFVSLEVGDSNPF